MAGDWIKMQANLPDKPEVWHVAGITGIDPDAVVGKLLRVWAWFDSHTVDGNAVGVSFPLIDRIAGVIGFGEALHLAGWLLLVDNGLSLPKFDRHNGKSAKSRALSNERVAKSRAKDLIDNGNADTVTKTVTREEKRRSNTPTPSGSVIDNGFANFWNPYPRKTAKVQAQKAWAKLNPSPELQAQILAALTAQCKWEQWTKDGGAFVPHASTWLNQRRWEDQLPTPATAPKADIWAGAL
jgi:hypothetical protein